MSYEKGMKLYDAVTDIKDETVEKAADHRFAKSPMRFVKPLAAAATILLVAGIGTFAALNSVNFKEARSIETGLSAPDPVRADTTPPAEFVPDTTPPETLYTISRDTTPTVTGDGSGVAVMTTSEITSAAATADDTTTVTEDTTIAPETVTEDTTPDNEPAPVSDDNNGNVVVIDGDDDQNPGAIPDWEDDDVNPGAGGPMLFRDVPVPVLPLTAGSDASGITAERGLTFDFSEMTPVGTYDFSVPEDELGAYTARDSYTLTNTTGSDKTVTLMYPFMSSFSDLLSDPNDWDSATVNETIPCSIPTVTVDGKAVDTALIAGDFCGKFSSSYYPAQDDKSNLDDVWDAQWYADLLKDGSYLREALAERPVIDEPVIVYRIYDCETTYDTVANDTFVTAEVTFTPAIGAEADIFGCDRSYGRNGSKVEFEFEINNRGVNSDFDKYIVVRGGDISEPKLQGYYMDKSNNWNRVKTDEISYKIERYEANYGDILPALIMSEIMHNGNLRHVKYAYEQGVLTEKTILDAAIKYMCKYGSFSEHPIERYDWGINDEMYDAVGVQRIIYVTFDVTVPAGGSVTVSADHLRYCKLDIAESRDITYTAEMYAAAGSTLDITSEVVLAKLPDTAVVIEDNIWAGSGVPADISMRLPMDEEIYGFKFRIGNEQE